MGKRIWSYEINLALFRRLVEVFGPHYEWEHQSYPGDSKEVYEEFCSDFSRVHGASGKGGTLMQVKWATTLQDTVEKKHSETYFRNKLAALEAGFIDESYIPSTIIQEF